MIGGTWWSNGFQSFGVETQYILDSQKIKKKQFNMLSHVLQIKTQNKNEVKNAIIRTQHEKTHEKGYLCQWIYVFPVFQQQIDFNLI